MEILSFSFVQRAILAGVLIASVASILGVFLVLRRLSLIGDGLAHITFGSVAVVLLVGVGSSYVTLAALPLVMLSSLAILKLTQTKKNSRGCSHRNYFLRRHCDRYYSGKFVRRIQCRSLQLSFRQYSDR